MGGHPDEALGADDAVEPAALEQLVQPPWMEGPRGQKGEGGHDGRLPAILLLALLLLLLLL